MTNTPQQNLKIAFFGTPEFAVTILAELERAGLMPSLIVTNPDRPKGRKLILTPPPVKVWAESKKIPVIQPTSLKDPQVLEQFKKQRWDMFIVAAYGGLIPKALLEIPLHNTLNVHPSLLPRYRGASPIQAAILADDKETGVSIMLLDEQLDHGPVLAQKKYVVSGAWPKISELEHTLAIIGGKLLAETIPLWLDRKIEPQQQDHRLAIYAPKISKADGLIDITLTSPADMYKNFLKIQAFAGWPHAYFLHGEPAQRVIITDARFENEKLTILTVIPEGRKETSYEKFLKTTSSDKTLE